MPMRHSHIAFRAEIGDLAKKIGVECETDEDDLGKFEFFDISVHGKGSNESQIIRFASHLPDKMVHLLAEDIDSDRDIAAALLAGNVDPKSISVSTDNTGKQLRDLVQILENMNRLKLKSKTISFELDVQTYSAFLEHIALANNMSGQNIIKSRPSTRRLSTKTIG